MSLETSDWLNTMTLIGFTESRGNAWHYRQGADNHFPGAVPMERVTSLFDFEVVPRPVGYMDATGEWVEIADRQAWVRDDNGATLGIWSDGYQGHQYRPWLVENVSSILDDTLQIGSAGLLKNGGQAWVQVEMPDSITTPEGERFRPTILAGTSFDGTIATFYKRVITRVVCDNTYGCARREDGATYKLRHTRHSGMRLTDARAALEIVHTMADDFSAEVAELCAVTVTDKQWDKFLASLAPMNDDMAKAAMTRATDKRDRLTHLYRADERCAPWVGTAWGALQAVNTYNLHETQVRKGAARWERIMGNVISGNIDKADAEAREMLMAAVGRKR